MEPIDVISARDISTAMLSASDKLTTEEALQGQALFVTKCRNETAPSATEVAQFLGELMQWQVQVLPPLVRFRCSSSDVATTLGDCSFSN